MHPEVSQPSDIACREGHPYLSYHLGDRTGLRVAYRSPPTTGLFPLPRGGRVRSLIAASDSGILRTYSFAWRPLVISETSGPVEIPASIFISYRRSDRETTERLYELLRERNVTAWYDALIPYDTDWREAIVEHLAPARVMVVLLSSAALRSKELKRELAVAALEGVPLLAVRLEKVKPRGAFAYMLAGYNWFDIFDDPQAGLTALADLLAEISKIPREADLTPLLEVWQKRWRHLVDRLLGRWTRNNRLLVPLFLFVSLVVFFFYNRIYDVLSNLKFGPLAVFSTSALVVTLGSPVILVRPLLTGVSLRNLPLLVAAAVNTVLLALLTRNILLSWAHRRRVRRRASQ